MKVKANRLFKILIPITIFRITLLHREFHRDSQEARGQVKDRLPEEMGNPVTWEFSIFKTTVLKKWSQPKLQDRELKKHLPMKHHFLNTNSRNGDRSSGRREHRDLRKFGSCWEMPVAKTSQRLLLWLKQLILQCHSNRWRRVLIKQVFTIVYLLPALMTRLTMTKTTKPTKCERKSNPTKK